MKASARGNRFGRLAWALAALCTLGALVQLVLWLLQQKSPISLFDWVQALGWGLAIPVVFSTLAALIIMRQPFNRVGWLMMLIALATVNPVGPILQRLPSPPELLTPGLWLLLWFDNWSWIPVIFPIFLIPLHFPSGRPPSPRWRWVNRLALGMWLFFIVFGSFLDTIGPSGAEWKLANPIGVIPDRVWLGPILIVWGIGLITLVSASVISLLVRYRRAPAGERQQIKWLLYAGAVFAVFYALNYFLSTAGQWGSANAWLNLLFVVSILAFPVAIAIAILRYRLYDIDVIIRKTLVYICADRAAGVGVLRQRGAVAAVVRHADGRRAITAGGGGFDIGHRSVVHAPAPPHPGGHRPALLPQEVRCAADAWRSSPSPRAMRPTWTR